MKKSKKFLSVLLAISMILAMSANAFAAESSVSEIKPLQVLVIEGDGSVSVVETIAPEDRISTYLDYYPFPYMECNHSDAWFYENAVQIPNQWEGGKTIATGQCISKGDDCIGAYIHSDSLDTINMRIEWSSTDGTYYYERGFNANYDLVLYFRANQTHDGGKGLYMDTSAKYKVIVSTSDPYGGYAGIEVCPGVYTGEQ